MQVIRPADELGKDLGPLLITGAASGIGFEVARLAATRGTAVALLDKDATALQRAAEELSDQVDTRVMALVADVRDEQEVSGAIDAVVADLGSPRGVVTCAGIDRGGLVHEIDPAIWDEVMAVNLRGTFLACRAAIRHMLESGGAIVCISSPFALVAAPGGIAAYSASKAGISALVRSLAVDYASFGIRVNALLPGPTETALMWANVAEDEVPRVRETLIGEVPLGRLAEPKEPAEAAMWLLSDAASFVTGSQLACDGGVLAKASISV